MKQKWLLICCLIALLLSPFTVSAQATEYTVIITNVEAPAYQDGNIVYIEGAVYRVTRIAEVNDDGSTTPVDVDMGEFTVGPGGAIFKTDVKGVYRFEQTKRAPGYLLITETFKIEFPQRIDGNIADDQTVEVMQKAIPVIGDVELLKVGPDSAALAGAVFELWQLTAPGQDVTLPRKIGESYVSGADGRIKIENLPEGSFEFREIQAPPGYEPITTPLKFEINPDLGMPIRIELELVNVLAPTITPTLTQTPTVTQTPTNTPPPGTTPTHTPTVTQTKVPTTQPTTAPTTQPTTAPTTQPTTAPTTQPTTAPTTQPTKVPTTQPTKVPTTQPTKVPTQGPIKPPDTGTPTEYIMLGVGITLLILFFWMNHQERKQKGKERS